jgi:curli biogenesis system outer membrane secretion channel CsgG
MRIIKFWGMLAVALAFGVLTGGCGMLSGAVASGVTNSAYSVTGRLTNAAVSEASYSIAEARGIKSATDAISPKMVGTLPNGVSLAVLSIESSDPQESSYIISELEYALVNSGKFQVVSRSSVDTVLREQNFQLSGNVSDSDAVSIGRLAGAGIVISGNVNRTSTTNTLAVKAIEVETARILFMERETFR